MSYESFRHFADSWWLGLMVAAYALLVGWAFLPSKRDANRRASTMIFDEDERDG
jgi:cytochrome c oxidase cbb3-type subunit 4